MRVKQYDNPPFIRFTSQFQTDDPSRQYNGLTPRVSFDEVLSSANHRHMLPEVGQSARRTLERHISITAA